MTPMNGQGMDASAMLGMVGQQPGSPDQDGMAREVRGDMQACADALTRIKKRFEASPQIGQQTDQMIDALSNLYMDILSQLDQAGSQPTAQPQML